MPDRVTLHHNSAGMLSGMSAIVNDLWGPSAPAASPSAPVKAPAFPPFDQLWVRVDDTVDWTEALVRADPPDSLTPPDRWQLYRRYARQVLSGDTAAYLDVLRAVAPLADLSPWAAAFDVMAHSADHLSVSFEALSAPMAAEASEVRRYLCGMSLRIARDLFALLPVLTVAVEARHDGRALLNVTFRKADLVQVRFAYVDPVAFVEQCGGKLTWPEA